MSVKSELGFDILTFFTEKYSKNYLLTEELGFACSFFTPSLDEKN